METLRVNWNVLSSTFSINLVSSDYFIPLLATFEETCDAYVLGEPPSIPVWSVWSPPPRRIRFTEETEGKLWGSQAPCRASCSRISQANIVGCSCFIRKIFFTTVGVATCCNKTKVTNTRFKKKLHKNSSFSRFVPIFNISRYICIHRWKKNLFLRNQRVWMDQVSQN